MAEWERWFENWWHPYGWRRCDQCPARASWIRWDRDTGVVDRACDDHVPAVVRDGEVR